MERWLRRREQRDRSAARSESLEIQVLSISPGIIQMKKAEVSPSRHPRIEAHVSISHPLLVAMLMLACASIYPTASEPLCSSTATIRGRRAVSFSVVSKELISC